MEIRKRSNNFLDKDGGQNREQHNKIHRPQLIWGRVLRIWNFLWGIIGGLTVLVTCILGIYSIHDRLNPPSPSLSHVREYIFGTKYYYVQALTDDQNQVLAYSVTTRDKRFTPTFSAPSDSSSGNIEIVLGKTLFSDLGIPDNIEAYLGAHDFYYHEEYYFGNPGNYQTYFYAANESGYLSVDYDALDFFDTTNTDPTAPDVVAFRTHSAVNTFYVTAPGEGWNDIMLREYLVGPDYDQTRVIPDSAMPAAKGIDAEYKKLSRLSTDIDIQNFIAILGTPLIINNAPTFDIRNDTPLNDN